MPSVPGTIQGIDAQHIQRYEFARNIVRGRRVYDTACGCGYGSLILGAEHYVGMDYNAEAVAFANEFYGNDDVVFLARDLQAMSPNGQPFDVCVSFETIEHLPEPDKFLGWAVRHCHTFVGSSPIVQSCPQSPFHVREYSIEEFRELLSRYWEHVDLFTQDGLTIRYPCQPDDLGNVIGVCW